MAIRNLGAIIVDSIRYRFIKKAFEVSGKRKYLLDLGCGVKPFRHIYDQHAVKSVGIDVAQSPHGTNFVDIVYDGRTIPFEKNQFDIVFCSEVMEHVPDPVHFLSEINRVMEMNGKLIMTTPFMVPLHEEPYDFYRYTKYGIRELLTRSGFEVEEIQPFSDYFGVILAFCLQLYLKIWSAIANKLRMKFIYSEWNPFIFVFAVVPQYLYLWYWSWPLPSKVRKFLTGTTRGYGYTAIKQKNIA